MTLLPARMNWMLLAGLLCLFTAGTAVAQSNPATCVNDDDCIATPACGGDVCDWATEPGLMQCKPAGAAAKGDGRLVHDPPTTASARTWARPA